MQYRSFITVTIYIQFFKKLKNKGYAECFSMSLPTVLTLDAQKVISGGATTFPESLLEM